MPDDKKIITGSGNVFADLGLPNADELQDKANLIIQMSKIIQIRGLSQPEAAKHLDLSQSEVANLFKGKLVEFSIEHLRSLLMLLEHTNSELTQ